MKRYLSILIVLVLLLSVLTGCGAASKEMAAYDAAAPEAAPEAVEPAATADEVPASPQDLSLDELMDWLDKE